MNKLITESSDRLFELLESNNYAEIGSILYSNSLFDKKVFDEVDSKELIDIIKYNLKNKYNKKDFNIFVNSYLKSEKINTINKNVIYENNKSSNNLDVLKEIVDEFDYENNGLIEVSNLFYIAIEYQIKINNKNKINKTTFDKETSEEFKNIKRINKIDAIDFIYNLINI